MHALLVAIIFSQPPLQTTLERALQGLPLHGPRFRAAVEAIAPRDPGEYGGPLIRYRHPLGRRDSTIVSIGLTPQDCLSFVVFRGGSKTYVESLNTKSEIQDGALALPELAAWSGSHLCVFFRYPGGTANSNEARLYELSGGRLRIKKLLPAFGENTWDGAHSLLAIARKDPVDIRECLEVRVPPPGLEDRLAHNGIRLDYRQEWRFSNGNLRQVALHPISTPASEMYRLLTLRQSGHRREFDRRVPPKLRARLWKRLAHVERIVDSAEGSDKRDACTHLLVGHAFAVTMHHVHGRWIVSDVQ